MKASAWNAGSYLKSGGGYGFRISISDRARYLDRKLRYARFLLEAPDVWARANIEKHGFWDAHTVMVNKSIGQWLHRKGYAPWKYGEPPIFRLEPLGQSEFRVVPEILPDSLPCHTQITVDEWREYQQLFVEGRVMETSIETRRRCQRLTDQLKEHFRDEETGLISCAACRWTKPREGIRGDIVHIHHHEPMHSAPREGRIIHWEDAVRSFSPLCPTCHALVHARPGGGEFDLTELRKFVGSPPKSAS